MQFHPDMRRVLTPEALSMTDTIARTGGFAAATRAMAKVPSTPTYSVRHHIEVCRVFHKTTYQGSRVVPLHYAWRDTGQPPDKALAWRLQQAQGPATRRALLEPHEGLVL